MVVNTLGRRDSTSTLRTPPSRRAQRPSRGLRRRNCLWRFTGCPPLLPALTVMLVGAFAATRLGPSLIHKRNGQPWISKTPPVVMAKNVLYPHYFQKLTAGLC